MTKWIPVVFVFSIALNSPAEAMIPLAQVATACGHSLSTDHQEHEPPIIPSYAQFVKPEQAQNFDLLYQRAKLGRKRQSQVASQSVDAFTADIANRQPQWPKQALKELQDTTKWQLPFGVSYDPQTAKTKFLAIGDKSLVEGVRLRLFSSEKDPIPTLVQPMSHQGELNDGLAWLVEVPGDFEGWWYDFEYTSIPGSISDMGEKIPRRYNAIDPAAPWTTDSRSRVYYSPHHKARPEVSDLSGVDSEPLITLELGLRDLTPGDVSKDEQGWALTPLRSAMLQGMTKPFSAVELLPVRNYQTSEVFSSKGSLGQPDSYYDHYWGYMPTTSGIALNVGGPDAMIRFIDFMHQRSQLVIKDEVIQHTANKPGGSHPPLNTFHFAMRGVYRVGECDRTGCGNTTNLDWGNPFTKFMVQMIIDDLYIKGFDGHRYDLMGAIPKHTTEELVNLTRRALGYITGEPYGVPFFDSFWNTEHETVRKASVWDHRYREELRKVIKHQGSLHEIFKWQGGGSHWTWVHESADRTAILETHDGETLAHYFDGDLKKVLFATAVQLFSQGDVTLSLSQIMGIKHPHLDNTPLDLASLSSENYDLLAKTLELVKIRRKINSYFAHPFLDEKSPTDYVQLSEQGHNSGYKWIKKSAYKDSTIPGEQQVLVAMNNSDNSTLPHEDLGTKSLTLPPGKWRVLGGTQDSVATNNGSANVGELVEEELNLEPFSVIVLVSVP